MTDSKKTTPKDVAASQEITHIPQRGFSQLNTAAGQGLAQTPAPKPSAFRNKKKQALLSELEAELSDNGVEQDTALSRQDDSTRLHSPAEPKDFLVAQAEAALVAPAATGVGAGVTGVGLAGSAAGVTGTLGMAGVATSAFLTTTGGIAAAGAAVAGTVATYSYLKGDDQAPSITALQSFSYSENSAAGTVIASVVASDNVGVNGFRFTATGTSTSADGYYTISSNGTVTLTQAGADSQAASHDFETV